MVSLGRWVVLFVLVMVPQLGQSSCVPSSCGKISNISHPFRRRDDPPNCGDSRSEIECVNDVAVLPLSRDSEAEYQVQAINYNNYTIRLVDPNIQDHNCSSIPRHFLYKFNFSDAQELYEEGVAPDQRDVDLYHATQPQGPTEGEDSLPVFGHVIYMSCDSPVREYSRVDKDTSCLDSHTYVVVGDLNATGWIWKPGCHVKLIAATSGLFQRQPLQHYLGWERWRIEDPTPNVSYSDIHRALAYGFELSWLHATCGDHCGSKACYFNHTAQNVVCYSICSSPYSLRGCGIWKRIRSRTTDFLYPFLYETGMST